MAATTLDPVTYRNNEKIDEKTFIPDWNNGNYIKYVIWRNCRLFRPGNPAPFPFQFDSTWVHRCFVQNDNFVSMNREGADEMISIGYQTMFSRNVSTAIPPPSC
jgi:hypothetical protein